MVVIDPRALLPLALISSPCTLVFEDHCSEVKETNKVNASYTSSLSCSWRQALSLLVYVICSLDQVSHACNCLLYEMVLGLMLFHLHIFLEFVLNSDAQN